MDDENADFPVWKSYVWHKDKCFFVSTISRIFDFYGGSGRGEETIVWEYDWEKGERGRMVHQGGSVKDHQIICRCIIAEGECPDEEG